MNTSAYVVYFVVAAVVANVVIYGGVTLAYFLDKRRGQRRHDAGASVVPLERDHRLDDAA